MKKIIIGLSLVLLVIASVMGTTVHAANESVSLKTEQNEYKVGDSFNVDIVISGITTKKGAAGFLATLEYDKDSLELDINNMKGQNGWSDPSYNEENGMFITDKNRNISGEETVITLSFKVKENAKQNLVITVKNISVSGGEGDVTIARAYKELTVTSGTPNPKPTPGEDDQKPNPNPGTNNSNTTNTDNQGTLNIVSNQTNDTASGKLPQTGVSNTVFVVSGTVAVIAAVAFFIKMKVLNIK